MRRFTSTLGEVSIEEFGSILAVVLAVTFGWAAIAKLRDPVGTTNSMKQFGLPAPQATARALPLAELVVAGALLAAPSVGALAAATMLAFFTTFLADRYRRGLRPSCHCFGAARSTPLSRVDLARNVVLLAACVPVLWVDRLDTPIEWLALAGAIAALTIWLASRN